MRYFLFFLLFSAFGQFPNDELAWLKGEWRGIGYQIDEQTWPVVLRCDGKRVLVQYPSLECSGSWELQSVQNYRVRFQELILDGKDNCNEVVQIVVNKVDERHVSIAYFLPGYPDVVAYAVLVLQPSS